MKIVIYRLNMIARVFEGLMFVFGILWVAAIYNYLPVNLFTGAAIVGGLFIMGIGIIVLGAFVYLLERYNK